MYETTGIIQINENQQLKSQIKKQNASLQQVSRQIASVLNYVRHVVEKHVPLARLNRQSQCETAVFIRLECLVPRF